MNRIGKILPWAFAIFVVAWFLMSERDSKPIDISPPDDKWFQAEVVNQEIPVLVKFGAQWCGPCRAMEPTLEKLSETMKGQVKIVDIDVDQRPELAAHYKTSSIPRLFLLDHGKIVADHVGSFDRMQLERWIGKNMRR